MYDLNYCCTILNAYDFWHLFVAENALPGIPKSLGDVLDLLPSSLKSCPLLLACPAAASCLQQLLTCQCEDPTTTPEPTTKSTPPPPGAQAGPQGGPPPPGPQGGPPPPGPQLPQGGPPPGGPPPQGPQVPTPTTCIDKDSNCPNMQSYCMNQVRKFLGNGIPATILLYVRIMSGP